jgi:hypothetical protein
MGKLRNDFNAFKEQQTELNQNMAQRLLTFKVQTQNSIERQNKNSQRFAIVVQISDILEKLGLFDDRV